jgi:two-component system, NtrC family, sensor kinase
MDSSDARGLEKLKKAAEGDERTQLLQALLSSIPSPVFYKDARGRYLGCNRAFEETVGVSEKQILGKTVQELWPEKFAATYRDKDLELIANPGKQQYEFKLVDAEGRTRDVIYYKSTFTGADGTVAGLVGVMLDITERKHREQMEIELRQAQKLQAVGQLAAGIAHELNTPIQFVGDSLKFLSDAFEEMQGCLDAFRLAVEARAAAPEHAALLQEFRQVEEAADLDYIRQNAPAAFGRVIEGVARISAIVGAMKEFAHPDRREKASADLNRALRATLTIARNEYKHLAEVETDFGRIPEVMCHVGDLNQVFLNLIVNAAHAIADVVGTSGSKGRIRVRTTCAEGMVQIEIADTGSGIAPEIRDRVFDPFFTTKPVGKGSGQGLAIARSIVVDKHRGSLTFESEVGRGTTFTIRLPVE